MQILVHLARFLPFVHRDQIFGVIRLHTNVDHFDVGILHGCDQLRILADLSSDLANHVHAVGVAIPTLQPSQTLIAELDRPQGRRMEVIGDKHLEGSIPRGVYQAVGSQIPQLGQPLELDLPGDHPVTEELLDNLAVGAAFGAPTYSFYNSSDHGVAGVKVFDGAEIGQLHEVGADQSLAIGLDDAAVFPVADARNFRQILVPVTPSVL